MSQTPTTALRIYTQVKCITCGTFIDFGHGIAGHKMHEMLGTLIDYSSLMNCSIGPICATCMERLNLEPVKLPTEN